ncbi:hypothetical protein HDU93_002432 [Gonapodya sp. JEL0774]|nr:hypothetical protein HDU93_002432 [Gonapodya sp. JEL0774]
MTVGSHLSASIRVLAAIPAKAGSEDKLIAGLKELVEVSNTQDGVLEYQLAQDTKDSTKFWMIESNSTKTKRHSVSTSAFAVYLLFSLMATYKDAHMASDVFKNAGPALAEVLGGELGLNWLTPVQFENPSVPASQVPHTSGGLRVAALLVTKPGKEEDFKKAVVPLIKGTHAEPGCLEYHLTQDKQDSTKFWMIETYVDGEAFAAHASSEHFKAAGPTFADLLAAPLEVHILKPVVY